MTDELQMGREGRADAPSELGQRLQAWLLVANGATRGWHGWQNLPASPVELVQEAAAALARLTALYRAADEELTQRGKRLASLAADHDEEKHVFANSNGMTEMLTVAEMIAEIRRLGERCRELFDSRASLAAALRWQPIETAPSAGHDVLVVVHGDGRLVVGEARLHDDGWYWANLDAGDYHASPITPTHWRSLPDPPTSGLAAAQEAR